MSLIAQLFIFYVTDIAYKFGYGSRKMVKTSPGTILKIDDNEAEKLRRWLVENGYLYEYSTTCKVNHGWTSHRISYGVLWTGVTQKGWDIAPKYTGFSSKEEAELEFRNNYALDHAGTDLYSDKEEYRKAYIAEQRPGWFSLIEL